MWDFLFLNLGFLSLSFYVGRKAVSYFYILQVALMFQKLALQDRILEVTDISEKQENKGRPSGLNTVNLLKVRETSALRKELCHLWTIWSSLFGGFVQLIYLQLCFLHLLQWSELNLCLNEVNLLKVKKLGDWEMQAIWVACLVYSFPTSSLSTK